MADDAPSSAPLLLPRKSAARFARCSSSAHDELRSFRACLAWLCVDHSPSAGLAAASSWAVFLLLAVAAPAAARLLPSSSSGGGAAPRPRPFDAQVQVSLTLTASLAYASLRALLRRAGGLRRLLYLDSLRRDSDDVQAGYAAQLARSFRVLACFVLPCALAEAAYKAYWYLAAAAVFAVVGGGGVRARGRLMGLPRRALLHGLRALPGHLLPADPADGGVRARVRKVRRRGHRAAAPPADQGAAQEDQPPVPKVYSRQPRARLRQPVRRAARHHQAARRRQSQHRRRARAVLDQPGGGTSGVPAQRGEDHAQDAGDDERGGGVARRRHRARLRQRPGEPGPGPAPHRGLPGARQRLPRGRRRRVRQRRRRRQPQRRLLPRRPQVRPVPGKQHLLPEAAGAGDVPGEQQGWDHGVRLRGGPGVAARALHDRVLARHVAARQDGRHLLNLKLKCLHPQGRTHVMPSEGPGPHSFFLIQWSLGLFHYSYRSPITSRPSLSCWARSAPVHPPSPIAAGASLMQSRAELRLPVSMYKLSAQCLSMTVLIDQFMLLTCYR